MGQFWMTGEEKQVMDQDLSNQMMLQTAKIESFNLFQHLDQTFIE